MIIADNRKQTFPIPSWLWKGLALCIFGLGVVFLVNIFPKGEEKAKGRTLFCDAEKVSGSKFVGKPGNFKNGHTQSNEKSLSGKYASKTGKADGLTFGISIDLTGFLPGETYKASVWRYEMEKSNAGVLAVAGNEGSEYYQMNKVPIERNEEGWEKLQVTFAIPDKDKVELKNLNVHTYSDGNRVVYFDDLKIELLQEHSEIEEVPTFALEIKGKNFNKITKKRAESLAAGIHSNGEDDWVNGKLTDKQAEKDMAVKLRLKGDWLDHLKGDKWSFRVKVKDPDAFRQMKTFSFQSPAARYFLHEWAFHQCLEQEDILTTRYDFVQLEVNGVLKGLYAYEEHFEKQLVESRKRREGPIVKFSEDGMWDNRKRFIKHVGYISNYYDINPTNNQEHAEILAFRESATIKNPVLKKQFETAQNLMYQYMNGVKEVAQVFDIERLAKYLALCEVFQANHGTIWHNQRFYYNPIVQKLEPIGFDGFNQEPWQKFYFLGMGGTNANEGRAEDVLLKLFLDKEFTERYIHYLLEYSSQDYMTTFFESIEKDAAQRIRWLEQEFPDYQFKPERFVELAKVLNLQIRPINHSLKIYSQSADDNSKQLQVSSIHHLPLELIGYGSNKNKPSGKFSDPIFLPAQAPRSHWLRANHPKMINEKFGLGDARRNAKKALEKQHLRIFKEVEVPASAKYVYFRLLGTEELIVARIMNWKAPVDFAPQQAIFSNVKIADNQLFSVQADSLILFKQGDLKTSEDIIIPENYRVIFPPGMNLDITKKAKFISKSPVYAMGKQDEPIHIFSSDASANGFTVLTPGDSCILEHTTFSNFNTLDYKGWTLTGAVTFYETQIALENCTFEKNHCEDGLNLVRCEFEMRRCTVNQTKSDGFDGDFCIGNIRDSYFLNTGNDGVDFSGSTINIWDSVADKCGDKGISVGEDSDVSVFDSQVLNSNIGVASKDLSLLIVENLLVKDCAQGFTAYQKKPEFGPSKIIINEYQSKNLRRLYQLGQGCSIQFPGEKPLYN